MNAENLAQSPQAQSEPVSTAEPSQSALNQATEATGGIPEHVQKPKANAFIKLANDWLAWRGNIAESSRCRYEKAIAEIAKTVASLNGQLEDQLSQWQTKRRAELSSASFAVELYVLKAILDYGHRRGKPKENCWKDIEAGTVANKTFNVLTREQFDSLIAEIRQQPHGANVADYCECLGVGGFRPSELEALLWRDVDFTRETILVGRDGQSKTHKSRVVPLFPRLREALKRVYDRTPDNQRLPSDRIFGPVNVCYRVEKAATKLGLPTIRPRYDFRHFFVVEMLRQHGVNEVVHIAAIAGHEPLQLLNRYGKHTSTSRLSEIALRTV